MPCRSKGLGQRHVGAGEQPVLALAQGVAPPHQPGDVLGLPDPRSDGGDQGGLRALQDAVTVGVGQHHAALDRPRVEGGDVDGAHARRDHRR